MPIYEYVCTKCGHRFEKILGVMEKDEKIACPKCGDSRTERALSSFRCGSGKGLESAPASSCGPKPGRFS